MQQPMDYVVGATKLLTSPKGIHHIVNNSRGDRMDFEMSTEMLEAEGITVKTLFVDDDVAVQNSTWTVGRRGVAGNFYVIKAVAAAAEKGASLDELMALGQRVNAATRSMGMALSGCTPPAKGTPIFTLADNEMEMGVGIHGEPGRARKAFVSANEIVDEMVEAIFSDKKPNADGGTTDSPFTSGDEVALMLNGLGGTPISELYLLYGRAHEQVEKRGLKVWRSYVGEYCTSLEMNGASVTLCKVDAELKQLLTAPADIPIRVF
jgi:dihydroxyacetone kinase-like protein